jgi:hypothetical protein
MGDEMRIYVDALILLIGSRLATSKADEAELQDVDARLCSTYPTAK